MSKYIADESLIYNEIVKIIEAENITKSDSIHAIHELLDALRKKGE